jgi:hypothetical protein
VRVECHPNFNVSANEPCVSVRPVKRGKRTYLMGSVTLRDVTFKIHEGGRLKSVERQVKNVHSWVVGDIIDEATEQYPLEPKTLSLMWQVFYHYNVGRYLAFPANLLTPEAAGGKVVDITDGQFSAAYCVGRRLYVSKEW